MHTSEGGIALIKEFEGFPNHGCPYRDPIGVWTQGFGHTEGVRPGNRCWSLAQAESVLRGDLARKYEAPVQVFASRLNQNQFDALVSFVFNLGPGILGSDHTIGVHLRQGNLSAVANDFMLYVFAGGRRFPGLVRRRTAERHLFLTPASKPLDPHRAHDLKKLAAWEHELAEIRAYIRRKGDGWHNHPKRWARARALKVVIERYHKKLGI